LFSFVFDPGLGHIPNRAARVGFLVSRYGYDFRAAGQQTRKNSRKNKRREKSRAGCGDL
jgi:hypothetical protein